MSKKIYLTLFLLVALFVQMFVPAARTIKAEDNIIYISSENDLRELQEYIAEGGTTLGKKYVQTGNITMSSIQWSGLGDSMDAFEGTYDGGNFRITNLTIEASQNGTGFVNVLGSNGIVKNLTLDNVSIQGSQYDSIGGIAGISAGKISDCIVEGQIIGQGSLYGGIVGKAENTTEIAVERCVLTKASCIQAGGSAGGICGFLNGDILSCRNEGQVYSTSSGSAGGIAGILRGNCKYCENYSLICADCNQQFIYAEAGGIAGGATGEVSQCYNYGKIYSCSLAGGVVGNAGEIRILNCCNNGTVTIESIMKDDKYVSDNCVAGGVVAVTQDEVYLAGCMNSGKMVVPRGTVGGILGAVDDGLVNGAMVSAERQIVGNYVEAEWQAEGAAICGTLVGSGRELRVNSCVVNADDTIAMCGQSNSVKTIQCKQEVLTLEQLTEVVALLNAAISSEEVIPFELNTQGILLAKDEKVLEPTEELNPAEATKKPIATVEPAATATPTPSPLVTPTATANPISTEPVKPTEKPTDEATVKPTVAPTIEPTVIPTKHPTVAPTAVPTVTPTSQPSQPSITLQTKLQTAKKISGKATKKGLKLSWKSAEKNVSFVIYRSKNNKSFKKIATVKTTNYTDDNVEPGSYYYQIQVIGKGGAKSDFAKKRIVVPWLIRPTFSLKKKRSGSNRILQLTLKTYQGKKVEVWMKGSSGDFIKVPLKNNQAKKKVFRMQYSKTGVTVSCRVRCFSTIKGKRRYSEYSMVKKIRL